jgi:hypothetical protein
MVGATRLVTAANGEFSVSVPINDDASVSSGIPALRFESFNGDNREVLEGTGQEIADFIAMRGEKLEVSARALIRPEALCRAYSVDYGSEVLRFPYTNRQMSSLSVGVGELNDIASISGTPIPIEDFLASDETLADGHFSFEWPLQHFKWIQEDLQERVFASWHLLGREILLDQLSADVPLCASSGRYALCERITGDLDREISRSAEQSVARITKAMRAACLKRRWRMPNRLLQMWDRQSGRNLAAIKVLLSTIPKTRYLCPVDPAPIECRSFAYPKGALMNHFVLMAAGRVSKELPEVRSAHTKERYKLKAQLDRIATNYFTCSK